MLEGSHGAQPQAVGTTAPTEPLSSSPPAPPAGGTAAEGGGAARARLIPPAKTSSRAPTSSSSQCRYPSPVKNARPLVPPAATTGSDTSGSEKAASAGGRGEAPPRAALAQTRKMSPVVPTTRGASSGPVNSALAGGTGTTRIAGSNTGRSGSGGTSGSSCSISGSGSSVRLESDHSECSSPPESLVREENSVQARNPVQAGNSAHLKNFTQPDNPAETLYSAKAENLAQAGNSALTKNTAQAENLVQTENPELAKTSPVRATAVRAEGGSKGATDSSLRSESSGAASGSPRSSDHCGMNAIERGSTDDPAEAAGFATADSVAADKPTFLHLQVIGPAPSKKKVRPRILCTVGANYRFQAELSIAIRYEPPR